MCICNLKMLRVFDEVDGRDEVGAKHFRVLERDVGTNLEEGTCESKTTSSLHNEFRFIDMSFLMTVLIPGVFLGSVVIETLRAAND